MEPQNFAPCGINCSLCSAFTRKKNRCPGCGSTAVQSPLTHCRTCRIRFCPEKKAGTDFCGTCSSYPCRRLKQLYKRYAAKYGVDIYENLRLILAGGMSRLICDEEKKWRCGMCGAVLCMHRNSCPVCGGPNVHFTGQPGS